MLLQPSAAMRIIHGQGCLQCGDMVDALSDQVEVDKTKFLACSRCKAATYCNKECQKAHWPSHRNQCDIFQEIKQNVDIKDSLDRMSTINCIFLFNGWPDVVTRYISARLPHCHVCFITDLNELVTCPGCQLRWACKSHWPAYRDRHMSSNVCETTQLMNRIEFVETENFRSIMLLPVAQRPSGSVWCPEGPVAAGKKALDNNLLAQWRSWDDYFAYRKFPFLNLKNNMRVWETFVALSSDVYTFPLTICEALQSLYSGDELRSMSKIVIHVIGAEMGVEIYYSLLFEEIAHYFSWIRELHIVFIGPDLQECFDPEPLENCPTCVRSKILKFHGASDLLYHEFFESSPWYETPTLAVAFNSGMHEVDVKKWEATVEVLLENETRCVFTGFNQSESELDAEKLKSYGATIVDGPKKNKWASLKPCLDPSYDDLFYTRNSWLVYWK